MEIAMSPRRTNRSELDDLTTTQRTAVSEGAVALDNLTGRASFNAWMQVARGIIPLCTLADKPGRSRNARRSLFKEAGYGRLSESNISRLLHMGRLESQIMIWRTGLTSRQRDTWNSPATICKKCPDIRKAIEEANKNKPPRQARAPRPAADPKDELERIINRVFDLLNAVEDIDLRRQQIERLITLLNEVSEPERPARRPPRPNVEVAINTIIDYGRELAQDERGALVARIATGLDLTFINALEGLPTPPAERPSRKRRSKKAAKLLPKNEPPPAPASVKPKRKAAPALVWKQIGNDFKAKAGRGRYVVERGFIPESKTEYFYEAAHYIDGKQRVVTPNSIAGMETVTTADEAKAFAQRDWEQGNADERTHKQPPPKGFSIPL
jgi:hypothetical protein